MEQKRICKRCLLAEIDNEKVLADVRKAIDKLGDDMRVDDNEYNRRLDMCKNCEKLVDGTCLSCGCYVELRAAAKISDCPVHKWSRR